MSEANTPKAGGLWARLFTVEASDDESSDAQPSEEPRPTPPHTEPIPVSAPPSADAVVVETTVVSHGALLVLEAAPVVEEPTVPVEIIRPLVEDVPIVEAQQVVEAPPPPVVEPPPPPPTVEGPPPPIVEAPPMVVAPPPVVEAPAAPPTCHACGAMRKGGLAYCDDCGWLFPVAGAAGTASPVDSDASLRESAMPASSQAPLLNRYEIGGLITERQGVKRHRGIDLNTGHTVVIVVSPVEELAVPIAEAAPVATLVEDDIMPGFDDEVPLAAAIVGSGGASAWPSVGWEKALLEQANHPLLPKVLDHHTDANAEYLILEVPVGQSLWDAWDEPDADAAVRYAWLQQIAAGMEALHKAGAIYEGIRPDVIVRAADGQLRITDITDVLPIPLPPGAPVRATLYTAPELIVSPGSADSRSDLYSFGALMYCLEYLHHPLEEKDFERQFTPKQITDRFPDVHPLFLRLINKTFTRDIHMRFPTDEMTKTDPSGFNELIKTLDVCRRSFDDVRLDISTWTTTGMIRTGNEDALTVLHGVDTRLDDVREYAMVLLCDGMGGYEAGEVAAAMALDKMREYLLQQPMFAALTGKPAPKDPVDPKKYQDVLKDALKFANREIYNFSRPPGKAKRMMGCTAEAVYIDGRNVIVGHVGDSRVYHFHRGRLHQLTRDQTLVNRLVELGQLTADEAENHPRKNELQQAIGGQPDVMPGLYSGKMMRGDWVLVCSDGLTNHISNAELEKMLGREASNSAEEAARRLLNLVNLRGATDNATIVVVRAS